MSNNNDDIISADFKGMFRELEAVHKEMLHHAVATKKSMTAFAGKLAEVKDLLIKKGIIEEGKW